MSRQEAIEVLVNVGLSQETALGLVSRSHLPRILQALEHYRHELINRNRPIGLGWLVNCLKHDWLATPLYRHIKQPDQWSINREENLILGGKQNYVHEVNSIIRSLNFWEWSYLAQIAVDQEEDEVYKWQMMKFPSRFNRLLSETLYSHHKHGVLQSPEYMLWLGTRITPKLRQAAST